MPKCGFIMVKRSFKMNWNKRFIKINGDVLTVSADENFNDIKERIMISNKVNITINSSTEFTLHLIDSTTLTASCESVDEAIDWLNSLKKASRDQYEIGRDSFDIIDTIGSGHYSTVYLARMFLTDEKVAIKVSKNKKVSYNEKEIIGKLESPFIIRLKFFFEFNDETYLGLEYSKAGDLFKRMAYDVTTRDATIYASELLLALQYLHQKQYVFRDLKPENIIIQADGHLKLTDFGLAKKIEPESRINKYCGTVEYSAPEVINQLPYGKECDVWSFGVVLYEILFHELPFNFENGKKVLEDFKNSTLYFPDDTPKDQIEIIRACLSFNPENRPTFEELKKYSFFQQVDWNAMEMKKYETDFLPELIE